MCRGRGPHGRAGQVLQEHGSQRKAAIGTSPRRDRPALCRDVDSCANSGSEGTEQPRKGSCSDAWGQLESRSSPSPGRGCGQWGAERRWAELRVSG